MYKDGLSKQTVFKDTIVQGDFGAIENDEDYFEKAFHR